MQHLSEGAKGRQVGSGGDGERWGWDRGPRGSLNEQIALVLMRLQEDMQHVLQRLHKLETLAASQVGLPACPAVPLSCPSWKALWELLDPPGLPLALVSEEGCCGRVSGQEWPHGETQKVYFL